MLVTMLVPNNEFSLAVHTYDFHIFTVIYSSLHRFIWDQHSDQLPIGLIAQLVMGLWIQIPYRADFFFQALFSLLLKQCSLQLTVKIAFIFMSLSAVHIYDFHIFTVINKSFIDQSCPVKMAGNQPCSFFYNFMDLDFVLDRTWQIFSHVDLMFSQ